MTFRITTSETGEHKPQYDGNRLACWRGGIGSLYPELPTLSGENALTKRRP